MAWLITAAAAAVATAAPERWALDLYSVWQGEWWRLASGHLVHLNWRHYGCDLAALGLVLLICDRFEISSRNVALTALSATCASSAVLLLLHPVDIYGGLSGITIGLLIFAALRMASAKPLVGCMLLIATLFKISLERHGISTSGVNPVWQAHTAGAIAGALHGLPSLRLQRHCHELKREG